MAAKPWRVCWPPPSILLSDNQKYWENVKRMTESIHYLDVTIRLQFDPTRLAQILKVGRQLTKANVQIPVDQHDPENESTRPMTDEEVAEDVTSVQDCMAEILMANPLFDQLGMEIIASVVSEEQTANDFDDLPNLDLAVSQPHHLEPVEVMDSEEEGDENPLDEINDTGAFLCRWPNGDCSVVTALTMRDAIVQLDEFGAAEPHMLHPIERSLLDFGLTESGDLQLTETGEETREIIYDACYPLLSEMLGSKRLDALHSNSASEQEKQAARKLLQATVETEKQRLWDAEGPRGTAKTELGKQFQRRMGASSVVADHYADQIAENILEEFDPKDEKPN